MKYLSKIPKCACAILLCLGLANMFTSCNDDMAAENYYTFTGEMMSDFLKNREDFSLFRQIVERAGEMDFLATRGARTLFPATNEGVEAFLKENGYASVEDIPVEYCDTLVKTALLERTLYTYNLAETQQESNQLDLPLIIVTDGDTLDASGMVLSVINRRAAIINEMKNDSVENGVVHPVDHVLVPSTSLGSSLFDENHDDFTIFYEALRRTDLLDSLSRYRDDDYEVWKNNYAEFTESMRIGNENYMGMRPEHRYSGFTLFIVPDEVLYEKYGDLITEDMTMDQKIEGLYKLAVSKYDDATAASIFGLDKTDPETGQTYKQRYWNMDNLTSRYNPLNMFLSYHILDRLHASTAKLVNCWGIRTELLDPTEWINTMLEYSTIKLERVYTTIDPEVPTSGEYYLNHSEANIYNNHTRVPGARLTVPDADAYAQICGASLADTGIGSTIFALKPGDGSAREQAASCQKVLGGWANLAAEYATKRYRSNLINWGMLPLIADAALAQQLHEEDVLVLPHIRKAVAESQEQIQGWLLPADGSAARPQTFTLSGLTEDERQIILDGCLINFYNRH